MVRPEEENPVQLKAGARDKTQADFANLLINRAHGLYEMHENEQLWAKEPAQK